MSDQAMGLEGSDPDLDKRENKDSLEGENVQPSESRTGNKDQTQKFERGLVHETDTSRHFVVSFKVPYWQCAGGTVLSILFAVMAVFIYLIMSPPAPDVREWMLEVQNRVGKSGVDVFKSFDTNRDGYLSIYEFEPLIKLLSQLKNVSVLLDEVMPMEELFLDYMPKEGEEVLILHAEFTPLQLDTMTTEDILKMDITGQHTLFGLRNWTEPNKVHAVFGASEFKSLLPSDLENPPLGVPYHVLPHILQDFDPTRLGHSSIRYYPPMPKDNEMVLFRLLGMMHQRPFLNMRFPPRGTVACVQAFNDKYVHVVFRMHAEFQLNEPPVMPFWFTPAQFLGDLVMSRDGTHVHSFHMRVPNERRLNVDMEWIHNMVEGEDGMEVDIGYMPLMEWTLESPSQLMVSDEEAGSAKTAPLPQSPDLIEWTSQAPTEDVLRRIEIEFYPFKKVTYHNLTRAVQLSREEKKPLHTVILWGALDDQSC